MEGFRASITLSTTGEMQGQDTVRLNIAITARAPTIKNCKFMTPESCVLLNINVRHCRQRNAQYVIRVHIPCRYQLLYGSRFLPRWFIGQVSSEWGLRLKGQVITSHPSPPQSRAQSGWA
ncbi:hypothetical protein J6590_037603 [Homalodisca vitripennis]|nr:hypothetical protein J6590_037603 [Homalodisca vitripennis]